MRVIIIELADHVTDEDAKDFVKEINEVFQPHKDAYFAEIEGTLTYK